MTYKGRETRNVRRVKFTFAPLAIRGWANAAASNFSFRVAVSATRSRRVFTLEDSNRVHAWKTIEPARRLCRRRLHAKRVIRAINRPTGDGAIIFSTLLGATSSCAGKCHFPVAQFFIFLLCYNFFPCVNFKKVANLMLHIADFLEKQTKGRKRRVKGKGQRREEIQEGEKRDRWIVLLIYAMYEQFHKLSNRKEH